MQAKRNLTQPAISWIASRRSVEQDANFVRNITKHSSLKYIVFLVTLFYSMFIVVPGSKGQQTTNAATEGNQTVAKKAVAQDKPAATTGKPDGGNGGTGNAVISSPTSPVITINLDLNNFSDYLPFDIPFKITGAGTDKIPIDEIIGVDLYYAERQNVGAVPTDCELNDNKLWNHCAWKNYHNSSMFFFDMPPLPPNRRYTFIIRYQRRLSEPERLAITQAVQPTIKLLVQSKEEKGSFDFTNEDTKYIIGHLFEALAKALRRDEIIISAQGLEPENQREIFEAVRKNLSAYGDLIIARKNDSVAIDDLKKQDGRLTGLRNSYLDGAAGPDKQKILDALNAAHRAIIRLYQIPPENQLNDAGQVKAYADAVDAASKALSAVPLANDAAFKKISKDVAETIDGMAYHVNALVVDYKAEQATETDELAPFTKAITDRIYSSATLDGSNLNGSFVTRSNTYVSADLGIAVIPSIGRVTPYLGTNIYLRPVNFDAPLRWSDDDFFRRRFSFVVGVSVASVNRDKERSDLLANNFNVMTGVGFRLAGWIHLGGGYLWYLKNSDNPLNTNQNIHGSYYLGLTFDLRIKTALNNLFSGSVISSVSP